MSPLTSTEAQHRASDRLRNKAGLLGLLFLGLVLATRLPTFFRSVIDWDESLYFMMAQSWRSGHLPYTVLWDNKPIGVYAIFALFQTLFGETIFSMRIATVIAVASTAFLVCRIYRQLDSDGTARMDMLGPFAGGLYVVCSVFDNGMAANTELFFAPFVCLALCLALPGSAPGWLPGARALAVGCLLGAACMVKYVAVFDAPAILLALSYGTLLDGRGAAGTPRMIRRGISIGVPCGIGVITPAALAALLYWATGHLPEFIEASILANVRRAGETIPITAALRILVDQVLLWAPLYLAATLLVVRTAANAWRSKASQARDLDIRAPALLLFWIVGDFVGIFSARLFFVHYFLQALPAFCIATAWVLARLLPWAAAPSMGSRILVLLFIVAGPAAGAAGVVKDTLKPVVMGEAATTGWLRDTPARIAAAIRSELSRAPGETLYVFDYQPMIYPLAGVAPPTRYAFPPFIVGRGGSRVAGIDADREFAAVMAWRPLFIVQARDQKWHSADDENTSVFDALRRAVAERYEVWKVYDEAIVYRRRGA